MVNWDSKVHNSASSLFVVVVVVVVDYYYKVWSSEQDEGIRLYFKTPEEFVRLILQDRFWFVHIPFIRMVNFKFASLQRLLNMWLIVSYLLLYHYHYYYYYYPVEIFSSALADGFFTGVWVTTSLLKSPGLFSVFWQFSIMLLFWWSPLVRQFPSPPGPLIIP